MERLKLNFLMTILLVFLGVSSIASQKYFTKNGEISFTSQAPLEKIEAFNKSATSVLDIESGRMEFAILIKSFHFEKALMQEHFNENYMESSKFPKAIFKGKIQNLNEVKFETDGKYPVQVGGDLTIHGETITITTNGTITIQSDEISADSEFTVTVEDFDISIPKVVRDNIAKEVVIKVDLTYQSLEQ